MSDSGDDGVVDDDDEFYWERDGPSDDEAAFKAAINSFVAREDQCNGTIYGLMSEFDKCMSTSDIKLYIVPSTWKDEPDCSVFAAPPTPSASAPSISPPHPTTPQPAPSPPPPHPTLAQPSTTPVYSPHPSGPSRQSLAPRGALRPGN